jgi:hypothetical protein
VAGRTSSAGCATPPRAARRPQELGPRPRGDPRILSDGLGRIQTWNLKICLEEDVADGGGVCNVTTLDLKVPADYATATSIV